MNILKKIIILIRAELNRVAFSGRAIGLLKKQPSPSSNKFRFRPGKPHSTGIGIGGFPGKE